MAGVGVTLAIVPGNGPQHQPRSLRAPRVPHAVTGRPASAPGISPMSWPPLLLQLPPLPSLAHVRGVSGLVSPRGTGPGQEEPVTRAGTGPLCGSLPPPVGLAAPPLEQQQALRGWPGSRPCCAPMHHAVGAPLPLSQVKRQMLREVKCLAQGHRGRWGLRSYDLTLSTLIFQMGVK